MEELKERLCQCCNTNFANASVIICFACASLLQRGTRPAPDAPRSAEEKFVADMVDDHLDVSQHQDRSLNIMLT